MNERDAILALARFGAACLREHRESIGDIDGGWAQETAVACGVLEQRTAATPCGEGCECHDFPTDCYFAPDAVAKMLMPGALERGMKQLHAPTDISALYAALDSDTWSPQP